MMRWMQTWLFMRLLGCLCSLLNLTSVHYLPPESSSLFRFNIYNVSATQQNQQSSKGIYPNMALRSLNQLKSMASRIKPTYTTATTPKTKAYAPTADQLHHHEENQVKKAAVKGDYVPVYVAIGMIAVSVSLGLFTAKHQILYSPNVRVKKQRRETVVEVEEPDRVVEEADKFINKSWFRKIAHVQEFENGKGYMPHSVHGDAFAHKPHAQTLKSVGIDPKSHHR